MQFTKTTFSESATSIEKNTVENRLWAKSEFLSANKTHHLSSSRDWFHSDTLHRSK